jgi:hypothetical protein
VKMSRIYSDYLNETVLPIPDKFINVETGEFQVITPKVQEEVDYHAKNNTLNHLVLSALNYYLHPQIPRDAGTKEILLELHNIKRMIQSGSTIQHSIIDSISTRKTPPTSKLNIQDIEDVLEAFGG